MANQYVPNDTYTMIDDELHEPNAHLVTTPRHVYDEFEQFKQNKGESIHDYYTRFAKLMNDMRNIKMTMSKIQLNSKFVKNMQPEWGRFVTSVKLNKGLTDSNYDQLNIKMTMSKIQLNSKFVNNMQPEWGRFVTSVKLNKGLADSNYDQLYAYLKQHEAHANENKLMLERSSQHTVDPLALMLKKDQEKDKIGSKPDKNGKCGEAGKSRKQLQ
nr:hypothetical protein [Tanacetum cinerariifolium]